MIEGTELDLRKVFTKLGSKARFRKLAGLDYMTDEAVEAMINENDGDTFLEGISDGGEPAFTVEWGALWHANSGAFSIYHFDGKFFAKSDIEDDIAGPFETAFEAAEWRAGIFDMDYSEEHGTVASVHFSSRFRYKGQKVISRRQAQKAVEVLTSHEGAPLDFYWCEAEPGKLFKDPLHGEAGKQLAELHAAQKDGHFDSISSAQQKFDKLTKKQRVDELALGEESKHFTSTFDSYLMKVPMSAKGKLTRFRTEWVRICLPRRVGKKTLATVILIENPMRLVSRLVPVGL